MDAHKEHQWTTFPVVRPRSPEDEVMEVLVKRGGHPLLAAPKHLVASGSTLTEVPVASVLTWSWVDGQVLTQHVAAANDVTGFDRRVDVAAALVAMGASLKRQKKCLFCMFWKYSNFINDFDRDFAASGHSPVRRRSPELFLLGPGCWLTLPSTGSVYSPFSGPLHTDTKETIVCNLAMCCFYWRQKIIF